MESKLLEDLSDTPFVFKFDETTNSQVNKQYDGYIRYMSLVTNKMTTAYVDSLFVGHCNAEDLLDHFFEFIKDFNLNTDLLISIGMALMLTKVLKQISLQNLRKRKETVSYPVEVVRFIL